LTEDVSQQITDARDGIFEEELFFEICREARLAANQGVVIRSQTVEATIGNDLKILLDYTEESTSRDRESHENSDSTIAEFIGLSMRLLLTAAHERNLIRRTQPPPPITIKPRSIPEYAILRPVLAHLRHRAEVRTFRESCDTLVLPLQKAGLAVGIGHGDLHAKVTHSPNTERHSAVVSDLLRPAKSSFKINLATGRQLDVDISTLLGPPLFGSRFETSEVDFAFSRVPLSRHETRGAALSAVRHILTLDAVTYLQSLLTNRLSKMNDKTKSLGWKISSPHAGELSLYDIGEAVRRVRLVIQQKGLVVRLTPRGKTNATNDTILAWTSDGLSKEAKEAGMDHDTTLETALTKILDQNQ
jgi:mediator of RNA polymerase II transcription subunit 17